ncbi:MAG: fumarylacetoacetate hydrolase family protein [Anaerolineae bacterium]|nr:fumarylacetoacetate hydrolase family protein [Anaerolineae bacterium]
MIVVQSHIVILLEMQMKILRYSTRTDPISYGWLYQDQVGSINGDPFGSHRRLDALLPLSRVHLHPPMEPAKIVGLRQNYLTGNVEQDSQLPEMPQIYLKPPNTLTEHKSSVEIPPQTNQLTFTSELGVVIGKKGRWISLDAVASHVFGYTCVLNFYAADLVLPDTSSNITRAYGFDGFCVVGPWIETEIDPDDLVIASYLNEKLIRMFTTHEMVFSINQAVAYISTIMTLTPGDLILTGGVPIPQQVLRPKDIAAVEIEGIGRLQVELSPSTR